jgi:hypothetical protein
LGSLSALAVLIVCGARRLDWTRLKDLAKGDEGLGYVLPFLLVLPIYTALICTVMETSLMLVAKIGTTYAAFSAARSAIVWNTAATPSVAAQRARDAAVRAMVPFACGVSGSPRGGAGGISPSGSDAARALVEAYKKYLGGKAMPVREQYLLAKYGYAERATQVQIEVQPRSGGDPWDEDITATVTYRYPFIFPGAARMLGERGADGQLGWPIVSQVRLQNEAPQNPQKRLGISYASPPQ